MDTTHAKSAAWSRRSFLAGTALAGISAVAALSGCSPSETGGDSDNSTVSWDKECDVVVVGSGTGFAAAIAAASEGSEVILLEKLSQTGGSVAYSGGGVWIANSTYSQELGDDEEKSRAYLKLMQRGEGDDELSNAFLENGQMMLDLLTQTCNIEWRAGSYTDYHPEWEGATEKGRGLGVSPREDEQKDGTLGGGKLLVSRLQEGADNLGVEIVTDTAAKTLVTANNQDGAMEITGVIADQKGKQIAIKARKGVVLAAGGFEWDEDLKRNYIGGPAQFQRSVSSNTGDALKMAMKVGADLRMMNACWGNVVYKEESAKLNEQGAPVGVSLLMDRAKPATIIVDKNGSRFCNEACDYDTLWWAFQNRQTWGDTDYLANGAYLIADSSMVSKFGLCSSNDPTKPIPEEAVVADTIEELAEKLSMDAAQLRNTIERFNANAEQGVDPDFHRGESVFDRTFMVDMDYAGTPQATLAPLAVPPFYALEVATANTGTHGGPRVNKNAQVLDLDGNPIPRLYAAGNTAGIGAPGMVYGGPGGTIGPGLVFNVIAGLHAAGLESL